jgi:RNA polymerase sigma-70 factor (ECF subfamily)
VEADGDGLFMNTQELLPNLFRSEYQKIVAVLLRRFGLGHIEVAEDIVSDTFLTATESWSHNGVPDNPTAWLYKVAGNKALNYLKHHSLFEQKLKPEITKDTPLSQDAEIDLSPRNISDSQLAMIFAVCNPVIPPETQIALALNLLCGFGVQEIANAFLTNKEVVYKRITRGKEKLKEAGVKVAQPSIDEINDRLNTVLTTIYLLFSEGYYSTSQNTNLRKDLCLEAMRLNYLLIQNAATNNPNVNALMALMCFHSSRFDARANDDGHAVLYHDQDEQLWSRELIERGNYFLNSASTGSQLSKYHLEAGIAYWHTQQTDTPEKWKRILDLYDSLLAMEYSPMAAINRAYAIYKVDGKNAGIREAEALELSDNQFYHSLLGSLYTGVDDPKALKHYEAALKLSNSAPDQIIIRRNIEELTR